MRSSIRFGLVAVGTLALLTIGFVTFRARLEPKADAQVRNGAQAGNSIQVAGCDTGQAARVPAPAAPNGIPADQGNPCLVISSFRQNGPAGTQDEFVEIFNASSVAATVANLDPATVSYGIGVFVSAGQGWHNVHGQAANRSILACQIPPNTIIPGRRWYLCGGQTYSLSTLGTNSGALHSVPDRTIGAPLIGAPLALGPGTGDIPDDAGMALLNIGANIVTQCVIGSFNCPSGFNYSDPGGGGSGSAVVFDKVGFNPWAPGTAANVGPGLYPANLYPSLAAQYCEGTLIPSPAGGPTNVAKNLGCLQPVGDASTEIFGDGIVGGCPPFVEAINPPYPNPLAPNNPGPIALTGQYDTRFPLTDNGFLKRADGSFSGVRKCYGQSGQYKIERRRATGQFAAPDNQNSTSGELHKDGYNSMWRIPAVAPSNQPTDGRCDQAGPQVQAGVTICGNNDDYILDAPRPSTNNVGNAYTGVSGISSILGNAWPHKCDGVGTNDPNNCTTAAGTPAGAPPIVGTGLVAQAPFDICAGAVIPCSINQLAPRNAERRYNMDPNIWGSNNDPFGTFILRYRFTPSAAVTGIRWRIDDISTLCGGQTPNNTAINTAPTPTPGTPQQSTAVGTQEARNLRGPDFSTTPANTPTPSCQGEGSEPNTPATFFTAILKGVNHYGEIVVDSSGTAQVVAGTVLEDVFVLPNPAAPPVQGALQPFGGGSNSTFVVNTTTVGGPTLNVAQLAGPIQFIGDGVTGGTGKYAQAIASGTAFRIGMKFGVVRSGRFKLLLGREAHIATPVVP